jgi:hypothetical protein
MPSNCVRASASVASKNRSANGNESTHWRSGFCGRTSSASSAGLSAIRRTPQERQKTPAFKTERDEFLDLLAWRDARVEQADLGYWRTTIGEEADFAIEASGKLPRCALVEGAVKKELVGLTVDQSFDRRWLASDFTGFSCARRRVGL